MATKMTPPRRGWRFAQRASRQAFPNDPRRATDMRAFVADFLTEMDVAEDTAAEILMAVGEVVANACRHGRRPTQPGNVKITCEREGPVVCIAVVDVGPGFDVDAVVGKGMPDLLSSGGRGFFLMHQLMDDVDIDSSRRGTKVVLQRRLPPD